MCLKVLFALLCSQAGQVPIAADDPEPSDAGTAGVDSGADPQPDTDPFTVSDKTQAPSVGEPKAETFLDGSDLDPTKLPPEIQAHFKRMQGVYTKKMQAAAELRSKAEVVDRFYNDQDYARQTLQAWAAQNGYQLAPIGQQAQQQGRQGQSQQGSQIADALKQNLAPELQWMADSMGPALETALQGTIQQLLQPLVQHQQQATQTQRNTEYDRHANELSQTVPHWEEHEDAMEEIHNFLISPAMSHPKYGNKLQLLYNAATSQAASLVKATERVNQAGKLRSTQQRGGVRAPTPAADPKKVSTEDAWNAAAKVALQKYGRGA